MENTAETGHGPRAARHPITSTALTVLALLLQPAAAVADGLSVSHADGTPAANAVLVLPGPPVRELSRADAGGRLALPDELPEGACVVEQGFIPLLLGADSAGLVLQPGASLRGTVRDADGKPVEGARVRLAELPEVESCLLPVVTGGDGAYLLDGLPPGAPLLVVAGEGLYGAQRPAGRLLSREARTVDLRVHRLVEIDVALRGADGKPLPSARVSVLPEWPTRPLEPPLTATEREGIENLRVTTDPEGRARLRLPRRGSWRIAVEHADHAPQSLRASGAQAAATVDLRLLTGGSLSLRAVDADGRSWPRPRARLLSDEIADADLVTTEDPGDEDGRLVLEHLPPGRWTVELRAEGARPRILRGVVVGDAARKDLGELVLAPGAAVAGVVEDRAGAPVGEAELRLAGWVEGRRLELEQRSTSDGRFRFEGLDPESRCRLVASAEGFAPARAERVAAGALDLLLVLERAGAIEATVVSAETGEPLGLAEVEALPESGGRSVSAEREGETLRLAPLVPGDWRLRATAPGYLPVLSEPVEVVADTEPLSLELALEAGRRLTGRVVDARDGSAIAGAEISAEQSGVSSSARSGLDGSFVLDGLDERVELSAGHEDYRPERLGDLSLAEVRQPLEIRLEPGGRLTGTVLGADGLPAIGAEVRLGSKRVLTDGDGGYLLRGLAPGQHKASKVDRPGSHDGLEEAWVAIDDGELTRHDFGLGARVTGTVRHRGEPVAGAQLTLWESASAQRSSAELLGASATSGDDGRYVLAGVPLGESTLLVRWQERLFSRTVRITDGVGEHRVDIAIPDLHLAGVVVEASTREPLAGATVMAQPRAEGSPRSQMMQTMNSGPDGEAVTFATFSFSRDQTGPDGRFRLLLDAPGDYEVTATAPGHVLVKDGEAAEPLAIESSREDLVLEMQGAARVTLKLRDSVSGAPLHGGYLGYKTGNSSSMTGGSATATMDSIPSGQVVTFVGWKDGWSPHFEQLSLEPGEERTIELPVGTGGTLVLLVPESSLQATAWGAISGSLQLLTAGGVNLLQVLDQAIGGNATQVAPEQWRFDHLPEGPLTIVLGEGDAARSETVEIGQGLEVEVDLR